LLLAGVPSVQASGQETTRPEFRLQAGLATTDFVSAPAGATSTTAFLVRFATRFPTGRRWLTPLIGASFTPYGSTGTSSRNTDAPTLFAGNIITLLDATRTSGWLSLELPVLITHSPGAGPTGNVRDYGRDLVAQPTAFVHLGARLLRDLGLVWSRFDLFASVEQNLTPNRDQTSGRRDRLNPVAAFGASITLSGGTPE
jgi:hypothetical protein